LQALAERRIVRVGQTKLAIHSEFCLKRTETGPGKMNQTPTLPMMRTTRCKLQGSEKQDTAPQVLKKPRHNKVPLGSYSSQHYYSYRSGFSYIVYFTYSVKRNARPRSCWNDIQWHCITKLLQQVTGRSSTTQVLRRWLVSGCKPQGLLVWPLCS
jgi:hypothetical protein